MKITSFRMTGVIVLLAAAVSGCAAKGKGMESEDFRAPLPTVRLKLVAEGLTAPVDVVPSPDRTGRLFIVDQTGKVYVLSPDGKLGDEPFLDLSDRMVNLRLVYDERGLLGLAFHPDFKSNGRFFVYYSAPLRDQAPSGYNHTARLSEFRVFTDGPGKVDPESERVILEIDQPQMNHNGGQLVFGPDGYLYLGLGDGGAANDEGAGHPEKGNGQEATTLLGSILRIDVDSGEPYGIPEDNPFVGRDGADEIFAYGLRNPYRFSFDAGGDHPLYVADVGQNLWEEVSVVHKGGNYGWNIKEGTHCFDPQSPNRPPADCPDTGYAGEPLLDPVIEYGHDLGTSIISGFIYRGKAIPGLEGMYVFGDWNSNFLSSKGMLLVATPSDSTFWEFEPLPLVSSKEGRLSDHLLALGQDEDNELYVLTSGSSGPTGSSGKVYRIVPEK